MYASINHIKINHIKINHRVSSATTKQPISLKTHTKIMLSSNPNSPTIPSSSLNHLLPSSSSEQLCYVHCNICDTVLAVSVPFSSLFKTVTVRCGHCSNLLPANMRGLLLPTAPDQLLHFPHSFSSPNSPTTTHHYFPDEIRNSTPNILLSNDGQAISDFSPSSRIGSGFDEHPRPPVINKPPEKRQRVPSAYNQFIKDEIQRIKAGNPDISHREAFSTAAKNWAHFPHIQFGLVHSDKATFKKTTTTSTVRQQGNADDTLVKDYGKLVSTPQRYDIPIQHLELYGTSMPAWRSHSH